jgi:divinyl protochlorophyllide a 8-vinyl-reductase
LRGPEGAWGSSVSGRIGPNAIIRVAEALPGHVGADVARAIFESAGLAGYLLAPPQQMVDEAEVARLHAALRRALGGGLAGQVARDAGRRTADYLLAHRIPKPVQALLKRLPAPLAARVLLSAISRHAWTFAGSGAFTASAGRPVKLQIRGNPMCRGLHSEAPACDFYAATFERLFRVLVHHASNVTETACEACGDDACRFEIRW